MTKKTKLDNHQLAQVDVISKVFRETEDEQADGVSFAWWNNEQLNDFLANTDLVERLNEDDYESLLWEMQRRLDAKRKLERDED